MRDDPTETYPERVIRHCPRCGGTDLAFSSAIAFTCKVCGAPHFLNIASAVAALIECPSGRLLLTRRNHEPARGALDVPGGFLNPLESAEAALAREIREELGLELEDISFFGTFPNRYVFEGLTYFTCDIVFRCRPRSLDALRLNEEVATVELVRPDEIRAEDLSFESVRAILDSYREFLRR